MGDCKVEAAALMQCTRSPGNTACAEEFLKMRECNRNGNAHFSTDSSSMSVTAAGREAGVTTGTVAFPPPRSLEKMQKTGDDIAHGKSGYY